MADIQAQQNVVRSEVRADVRHYGLRQVEEERRTQMVKRYIDADALLKQIGEDSEGSPGWYGDTWQFIDTIENAPTIKTKQIKYYDEDEQVWKVGSVIVDE